MKKLIKEAVDLAENWQFQLLQETTRSEAAKQAQFQLLADDKASKNIMVSLFDRSFRSTNSYQSVSAFRAILLKGGIPKFFEGIDRLLIQLFIVFGQLFSSISLFFLKREIINNTKDVIIIGSKKLKKQANLRKKDNFMINVNQLGEVVLGDKEAQKHLNDYIEILHLPYIDYISIKISNLCSCLVGLAYEKAYSILYERLSTIYQAAIDAKEFSYDGLDKFVNLDMEEYKDFHLTLHVFKDVLMQEKFLNLYAGIVLQCYLPETHTILTELNQWAKKRVLNGGKPIKVRLVKGANLQQEIVHSSLIGLPCPVYGSKLETDANFKRILDLSLDPEFSKYIKIGVASHNLFDLAYANLLAKENKVTDSLTIEMLEGMANPLARVLCAEGLQVLLYVPYTEPEYFLSSVGYLIRRLDENTGSENFLRHSFNADIYSQAWEFLKEQFIAAQNLKDKISSAPRRQQNRQNIEFEARFKQGDFLNEIDTDFHLPQNYQWAKSIIADHQPTAQTVAQDLNLIVGEQVVANSNQQIYYDINQPQVAIFKLALADSKQVQQIISFVSDPSHAWFEYDLDQRHKLLREVAKKIREHRGYFIGLMAKVTGKVFAESDVEISEAIDFLEYYPYSLQELHKQTGAKFSAKGLVLVIAPWNFPFAIPIGGVASALAAGNSVILKPAPEAAVIAYEFVKLFWEAGIPRQALQLVVCEEGAILDELVQHEAVKHIIFTGSTFTSKIIINNNPTCLLSAETGGKNSTIITAAADLDLAIKNVVHSAFSNGGQKCSATSLLILEKSLYQSDSFKNRLLDCAQSFINGSAWDLHVDYGPLINQPTGAMQQAIADDVPGQYWLLKPKLDAENKRLLSPGIKWGVQPGSFLHKTELFGPILAVMCAKDLPEAVDIANQTEYGLTAGLESLDENEQLYWKNNIQAGNLYINRGTVGAIVQRQPFGGVKKSAFGPGVKAGGPSYCLPLSKVQESPLVAIEEKKQFADNLWPFNIVDEFHELFIDQQNIVGSYQKWMNDYFNKEHDPSNIIGQDNILRYLKGINLLIRVDINDSFNSFLKVALAASICKSDAIFSIDPDYQHPLLKNLQAFIEQSGQEVRYQCTDSFLLAIANCDRLRLLQSSSKNNAYYKQAAVDYIPIVDHIPYDNGRLELVFYLQEQAISSNYHRYGNLGDRADD